MVDGNWVTDSAAPEETDSSNISNNILHLKDVKKQPLHTLSSADPNSSTALMAGGVQKEVRDQTLSSAAPDSTTAQMAGQVPKEEGDKVSQIPGAFPNTPAVESEDMMAKQMSSGSMSENPTTSMPEEKIPQSKGSDENLTASTSRDPESIQGNEDKESEFGVKPIPATMGIGNPIQLKPGQSVPDPSNLTQNTVQSTVRTDEQSYLKGDAGPPQLGPVVTPEVERDARGDMFGIGPVLGTIVPESSLPMGGGQAAGLDPAINVKSADPQSTTAMLAAQVPREPRGIPQIVKDSQQESEADRVTATAASPDMLKAKENVGKEIDDVVPTEAPTSDSEAGIKGSPNNSNEQSGGIAAGVPPVIKKSIAQAHESPEAATNSEAVQEKKAVESELLKEVKPVDVAGEPAPTATAATSAIAPIPLEAEKSKEISAKPEPVLSSDKVARPIEEEQPTIVASAPSQSQQPITIPPTVAVAATPETKGRVAAAPDSRDVSPMSKPVANPTDATKSATSANNPPATAVTAVKNANATTKDQVTPANTANTSTAQATPQGGSSVPVVTDSSKTKDSIDSPTSTGDSPATDKKSKRRSIFGRVKDKIKHF